MPEIVDMTAGQLDRAISDHRSMPHETESPEWNRQLSDLLAAKIRIQARELAARRRENS